jgi:hypothetical protein
MTLSSAPESGSAIVSKTDSKVTMTRPEGGFCSTLTELALAEPVSGAVSVDDGVAATEDAVSRLVTRCSPVVLRLADNSSNNSSFLSFEVVLQSLSMCLIEHSGLRQSGKFLILPADEGRAGVPVD